MDAAKGRIVFLPKLGNVEEGLAEADPRRNRIAL